MRQARSGHSLAELVIVMSFVGVILSTVGATMHTLQKTDRLLRDSIDEQLQFDRLSERLRCDVHLARDAQLTEPADGTGATSLRLIPLDAAETDHIEYELFADRVERRIVQGDSRSGEPSTVVHRDSYYLPNCCLAEWKLEGEATSPSILLSLRAENTVSQGYQSISRFCEIRAAVGLIDTATSPAIGGKKS